MMIISALFAAIIGVLAQVTVPLPIVPIDWANASHRTCRDYTRRAIWYIVSTHLFMQWGNRYTGICTDVWRFRHSNRTYRGYLIGFIPTALIIGYFLENTSFTVKNAIIANVIGMLIALTFGTTWLKLVANLSWIAAFTGGFAPFILVGLIKATLAAWAGIAVRNRLRSTNLLKTWSAAV